MTQQFYVTTPIYYVNDRPHIGHVYSTTLADVLARYHRLLGQRTFFLTGTDEHAAKVVDSARQNNMSAQEWADRNAAEFESTFAKLGMTNDDFIRTSQERHKTKVLQYIGELLETGDVYEGQYEGWYDAGQEEYVPENKAKEYDYNSPINGKPLVKKKEKNYFFKLSKYQDALEQLMTRDNPSFVRPEARKNEVLARIREGLHDVPVSRTGAGDWGIRMPGDENQTIYVWIDALFNYLSTVDTDARRDFWPADVHLIAKDILWFHAVIWPAMLMALGRDLPKTVYTHSFWIAEGQKMSKSLGNFIDLEKIDGYVRDFGLDALRWFLATQGPLGATDADFAHAKFVDTYNADLANTLGNCVSRVTNMTQRYFEGVLPEPGPEPDLSDEAQAALHAHSAEACVSAYREAMDQLNLSAAAEAAMRLVRAVDGYIEHTQPFKLAKDEAQKPVVGTILGHCAEALRVASVLLWPFLPGKIEVLWQRFGRSAYAEALTDGGAGDFAAWTAWGQSPAGTTLAKGEALFPRYQEAE